MKLKLKAKIAIWCAVFLLILTVFSTITVSIIISRQNRKASHDQLKKSFVIFDELISSQQEKFLANSRQMSTINDMGGIMNNLVMNKKTYPYIMLRIHYSTAAETLQGISSGNNIQKAFIYDINGELTAFSILNEQGSFSGFIHDEKTVETMSLKPDEKFNHDLWEKQDHLPDLPIKFNREIPTTEIMRFENVNGVLGLVSYVPIIGTTFDGEMTSKQFGVLVAYQRLESHFIDMVSRLSGTKINIYTHKGLSVGNFVEYTDFDMSEFTQIEEKEKLADHNLILNSVRIGGKGYFQGIQPVLSGSEYIAAIVSLYSEDFAKANTRQMIVILVIISLACILLLLPGTLFFANSIIKPIIGVVTGLKDVAEGEGDLTARLDIKNRDEVGELAHWFNKFIMNLQKIIKGIAGNADTLNISSSDLLKLTEHISDNAGKMSGRMNSVSMSSEEMSSNMNSVAAAMEEASTNISMVATSAEEMTSTINEIAQNSEHARSITAKAVARINDASEKVDELGTTAQKIGKVTETITEISEQTNLLALNATIEAARAGEAGKGFAVVANEIKELAKQTAEATEEIKEQIGGIQSSTSGTVSEIDEINKVINEVHEIVVTIATAIEEQSLTTKEIAKNVTQASKGISEVNMNVAQSSEGSQSIAGDITEVNQAANEISDSSSQMNHSSKSLNELAEELKNMVSRFRV